VDIEFKCTTARANELRELMREWKREADQQHEAAEKIKLLTSIK
jgi:predicted small metal-binding protein